MNRLGHLLYLLACLFAPTLTWADAPKPLQFTRACEPGETLTVTAVGDVLLRTPLQEQAHRLESEGRFKTLWRNVMGLLSRPDVTYANLEGPAAYGLPLGDYPRFNYDPALIEDLRDSGVDVVSTANNHAMDRGSLGADRTIEKLRDYGLAFTGTRHTQDQNAPWYALTEARGFTLAWLACTFSTNQIEDPHHQVLNCYRDIKTVESTIRRLAADPTVDAIIVTPHWGREYEHAPRPKEVALGRRLLKAGALAVIGSHPHVLQPWEKVLVNGEERFILYSAANFVSNQVGMAKNTALILTLGLTRGSDGRVFINGARHVPTFVHVSGAIKHVEAMAQIPDLEPGPLELVRSLFSSWNEISPDDPMVTNPQCGQ